MEDISEPSAGRRRNEERSYYQHNHNSCCQWNLKCVSFTALLYSLCCFVSTIFTIYSTHISVCINSLLCCPRQIYMNPVLASSNVLPMMVASLASLCLWPPTCTYMYVDCNQKLYMICMLWLTLYFVLPTWPAIKCVTCLV